MPSLTVRWNSTAVSVIAASFLSYPSLKHKRDD